MSRKGNLFVISGPSGAGKGTLVARLLEMVPDTWVSVSCTTRSPRAGELEGVHYYFKTRDEFMGLAENGGLLEWAEYSGNCYGTPRQVVEQRMAEGAQVILEIDMQGAFQVKASDPAAVTVFILPPEKGELRSRLEGRHSETPETLEKRMKDAARQMPLAYAYDYVVLNDDLEEAVGEVIAILQAARRRTSLNKETIDRINKSFQEE